MGNSGGSRLPEEKKANMWPGRGNSGGSWPPAFAPLITIEIINTHNFIWNTLP